MSHRGGVLPRRARQDRWASVRGWCAGRLCGGERGVVLAGALRLGCWPGGVVSRFVDRGGGGCTYFVELVRFEQFPCVYELVFEDLGDGVEGRHLAG
jgi:hypothetical protein